MSGFCDLRPRSTPMQSPASWRSCMSFNPLRTFSSGNVRELDSEISTSGGSEGAQPNIPPSRPSLSGLALGGFFFFCSDRSRSLASPEFICYGNYSRQRPALSLTNANSRGLVSSSIFFSFSSATDWRSTSRTRRHDVHSPISGVPCSSSPHPCRQLCPIADQLLP